MAQKTRIALTVNKAVVDQFRADLKTLNLHPAMMSNLVDEWLTAFGPVLHNLAQKKQRGEQITFDEVVGTIMEEMGKAMRP